MKIISRAEWGARQPNGRNTTAWSSRTGFVVHHSGADDDQTVKQIQNYHMDTRGWSDVGYNFLIDKHGRIYEGRGWTVIGAHAAGHNTANIGVCVIGDYSKNLPPEATLDALAWLYDEANRRKGSTLAVRTHRMVGSTSCPGDKLHSWVKAHLADEDYDDGPSKPSTPSKPSKPSTGQAAPTPHYSFPLPSGYYFGPKGGPKESVSGYYGRSFKGVKDRDWLKRFGAQMGKRSWNLGKWLPSGNDGYFGPQYQGLVKAFQADQGLTRDGKLGPKTWRAAFENPVS